MTTRAVSITCSVCVYVCVCLQAEKRVYQLELMNREKNYNKLFNVNPQVGVLNPLQLKVGRAAAGSAWYHLLTVCCSILSPELAHFNVYYSVQGTIVFVWVHGQQM